MIEDLPPNVVRFPKAPVRPENVGTVGTEFFQAHLAQEQALFVALMEMCESDQLFLPLCSRLGVLDLVRSNLIDNYFVSHDSDESEEDPT